MVKLIIFIALLGYICSQTVPSFDLSTIPAANSTATPCVTPTTITSSKDCTSQSTTFSYCCQLTPLSGTGSFCQSINPTSFSTSMKTWTLNNTSYNIQCDITEGATGTPCGILNPKSYQDCTKYSTTSNSCCLYSNSTLNVNYCFWIGMYMPVSPIPAVQCTPPSTILNTNSSFIVFRSIGMIFILATTILFN